MECQILFSRENKKNISACNMLSAEIFFQHAKLEFECLSGLYALSRFSTIFCKGDNFCDFLFAVQHQVPS